MDKTAKDIRLEDIVEIILRRRWYIIIPFFLCIVMGFILMFVLPKYYQAETLVLVYPPKVPKNFVQPVIDWDVESRVEVFSRQILSRSNLKKIMKKFDMFADPNDRDQPQNSQGGRGHHYDRRASVGDPLLTGRF